MNINKMDDNKLKLMRLMFLTLVLIYFGLFFMTIKILPMVADDFGYRDTAIKGNNVFLDGLSVAKNYYYVWGGRSIAHFFAHIIMWSYSPQFGFLGYALINTLVLFSIIYNSFKIVTPKDFLDRDKVVLGSLDENQISIFKMILFSFVILFLTINPKAHYQTLIWATGVAHYSWMYAIFIATLAKLKNFFLYEEEFKPTIINFLLLFLTGLSYENIGLSLSALIIFQFILKTIQNYKQDKVIKFKITSLLPLLALLGGAIIMLFAPGNQLREKVAFPEGTGTYLQKINWWVESWLVFLGRPEGLLVLIITFVSLYLLRKSRANSFREIFRRNLLVRNLGLLCILMAACYLGHNGNFYGRKGFNVGWIFCLFLISLLIHSGFLEKFKTIGYKAQMLMIFVSIFLASVRWTYDYSVIFEFSKNFNFREKSILSLKEAGQLDINTYNINNPFGLEDLAEKSDHWINIPYSNLLGVKSIKAFNLGIETQESQK